MKFKYLSVLVGLLFGMLSPAWADSVCYHSNATDSKITFQFMIERSAFTGRFTEFQLDYCWQDTAPETGTINVTVDISSVQTGNSDLDIGMQEKEGLNSEDFPKASWKTTSIEKQGDIYSITGQLGIRDVTRTETGQFKLEQEGDNWKLTGSAIINRLDYNVGIGEFSDITFIPNNIKIEFSFLLKPS